MGTSDLARSLVDAAAEALAAAGFVDPDDGTIPVFRDLDQEGRIDHWTAPEVMLQEILPVVLTKLSEGVEAFVEPGMPLAMLDTYLLRDLADAIREGR